MNKYSLIVLVSFLVLTAGLIGYCSMLLTGLPNKKIAITTGVGTEKNVEERVTFLDSVYVVGLANRAASIYVPFIVLVLGVTLKSSKVESSMSSIENAFVLFVCCCCFAGGWIAIAIYVNNMDVVVPKDVILKFKIGQDVTHESLKQAAKFEFDRILVELQGLNVIIGSLLTGFISQTSLKPAVEKAQ